MPSHTRPFRFLMSVEKLGDEATNHLSDVATHDHAHCMGEWAEICNRSSNRIRLHHQIDQAFLIFLAYVEKKWEGLGTRLP